MDQLPQELILHMVTFLDSLDILILNLVSKRFLAISRDRGLWKNLCVKDSPTPSRSFRNREGRYGSPITIQEPGIFALQRAVADTSGSRTRNEDDDAGTLLNPLAGPTTRSTEWQSSEPGEAVDWYHEYIARHAPLSMSWLPPARSTTCGPVGSEIRGMGLLKKDGREIMVTPMGDGSVCLWDLAHEVERSTALAGRVTSRSNSGILLDHERGEPNGGYMPSDNAVECVSVDQSSGKAYIAAGSTLTEVDLTTLQASGQKFFANPICAISEGGTHPNPMTVGTTKSIHLYDPRGPGPRTSAQTSLADGLTSIDSPQSNPFHDFQRLYSSEMSLRKDIGFASVEPLPLSTVHLNHDILVGGRFPSILTYDRRFFPTRMTSIHSGARISALATIQPPNGATKHTLVAVGEYKGKGSLELYPLPSDDSSASSQPLPSLSSSSPTKNRATASRSKLLSVIAHGTRLLFSDLDGQVKWVERDGRTLVRRWNINNYRSVCGNNPEDRASLFTFGGAGAPEEGEVARKMLAVDEAGEKSDVLIFTGEKVGVMGYGRKTKGRLDDDGSPAAQGGRRADHGSGEEAEEEEGEDSRRGNELEYGRMMRRALERQADEVRFVRGLGLGG